MPFERDSALDLLADALRRADATWHGGEIEEWSKLPESQRQEWRALAREAAISVYDEISMESRRVTMG